MKNQTVILAAGLSARMKTYEPRCLIKINDKAIIDYQIYAISQFFTSNITIVGGYKANKIIKKFADQKISVVNNKNFLTSNTVEAVKQALKCPCKSLLITHGDLVFNKETLDVPKNKSFLIIDNKQQMSGKEIGVVADKNIATNLSYGLKQKWCQIVYLTGKELEIFQYLLIENVEKFFIFEIINKIINNGGIFQCYEPKNMMILEIDCVKDLKNEQIKNFNS